MIELGGGFYPLRAQPDLAPVNIGYGLKVDSQMWLQLQLVIDGITVEKHWRRVAPLLSARSIMSVVEQSALAGRLRGRGRSVHPAKLFNDVLEL